MLETLHLTKIYRTMGGATVRALDDVSIRFPEKGMVFLLGKSGSGKSTLLNVCGGLDSPTSGAIIVKGRSSNAFSQSDFDSYRNTFVGFIFQEYNILNEFTVEDNIALALELQGKPKDKKVIADLLEQVDLAGYANRKPNTLSGGQKQRIAIARALVKSPEIIMADEPTGALDSETGRQVFETLKKLSQDKLVIVVSHDRDFAETYGDRIIELKDGRVISDVTKTHEEREEISSNISIVGETLCVKKGADLNEADFEEIKNFLSKAENDVIIATGENEVKEFKENNHIRDDGGMEVFRRSEEMPVEQRSYRPEESRFIRSKLPAKHAFKIGVSSLKTKPIRLAFTILLCTVAFIFFGLLSTMTFYDKESTFKQSLKDSAYSVVQLGKVYQIQEYMYFDGKEQLDYTYLQNTKFTKDELKQYVDSFGKDTFGAIVVWMEYNVQNNVAKYWDNNINYIACLDETNSLRGKITGKYPQKEDEICISSYAADVIFNCKITDSKTGELIVLEKPEDVIGKKIVVRGTEYIISGIFESGEIPEKYEELKETKNGNFFLSTGLTFELQDGLHLVAFVNENTFAKIVEEYDYDTGINPFESHNAGVAINWGMGNTYKFTEYPNALYGALSEVAKENEVYYLTEGKTSIADNETVISTLMFAELIMEQVEKDLVSEDAQVKARAVKMSELASKISFGGVESENSQTGEIEFREYTEAEMQSFMKELVELAKEKNSTISLGFRFYDDMDGNYEGDVKEYVVAGILNNKYQRVEYVLFNDKTAEALWDIHKEGLDFFYEYRTKYTEPEDIIYQTIFLPYNHSDEQTNMLWDIYENEKLDDNDSKSTISSMLIANLEAVDEIIKALSKVFLYAGIIMAVFAALLLSNFISVSISYKKREIGILRAVGARSIDVFKIFFSESFVITAICVILSLLGSVAICAAVNGILVNLIGASLFVFGPLSLCILLAVAIVTAVVATFLPVWNAAKKKPVESIRAL